MLVRFTQWVGGRLLRLVGRRSRRELERAPDSELIAWCEEQLARGRVKNAKTALAALATRVFVDARALLKLADLYRRAGDINAATTRYAAAAKSFSAAGVPHKAVALLGHVLQLNPNAPDVHVEIARALVAVGRTPDAFAHYQEALRLLEPQDPLRASTVVLELNEARARSAKRPAPASPRPRITAPAPAAPPRPRISAPAPRANTPIPETLLSTTAPTALPAGATTEMAPADVRAIPPAATTDPIAPFNARPALALADPVHEVESAATVQLAGLPDETPADGVDFDLSILERGANDSTVEVQPAAPEHPGIEIIAIDPPEDESFVPDTLVALPAIEVEIDPPADTVIEGGAIVVELAPPRRASPTSRRLPTAS